ncbi:MAG: DUF1330 domain-containing protein [Pseudomonadota bacterium]
MTKGYWIGRIDVSDPERYKDYISTATPAYQEFGAKFLVRGGTVRDGEGDARSRNVVIEFPSIQAAIDCYNSEAYSAARAIRQSISEGELIIIEGFDG